MQKRTLFPAALALSAALWLAAGCTPPPPPANPAPPANPGAQSGLPGAPGARATSEMADTTPVRDAVTAAIKQRPAAFPKGTTVESVTVQGGVATLDFSPEFSQLANMGDSTESAAQRQLRAALAKFPAIEKMHVTVKGKPFDSQVTDWTTPFPVRDIPIEGGSDGNGGAPAGAGQRSQGGGG